ncbi:hypothetical protein QUF70_10335 [Desulfobacterales bacterium HSG17]|nr:hypothetical protein [Desulfobacterales bacterium HSG17]
MSYIYLLDLYQLLDQKMSEMDELCMNAAAPNQLCLIDGRKTVIKEMKQFLTGHFHERLPKRIQNKMSKPKQG